jgi:hypothetical protein
MSAPMRLSCLRGEDQCLEHFFTYVRLEDRIPADHPLRAIHELVDAALKELSQPFAKLYAREGRPSITPERLQRALLLQALNTIAGVRAFAVDSMGCHHRDPPKARQ